MSSLPHFDVLARGEQTGAAAGFVRAVVPAGWAGTPLHHHDFDEAWYVLDGTLTFQVGEDVFAAPAGTLTFAPRGVTHAVANHGDRDARYLLTITPAGFERYFDDEDTGGYPETIVDGPQIGVA